MTTSPVSPTQADQLASRLRMEIQKSELEDGDFFMTEADLAETYKVSRTVAREAVGRLKSLGLLEGRKRKGLIVRRPDPLQLLTQTLPSLLSSSDDLRELGALRYVLEIGSVELAIQRARPHQIIRLGELVEEMEKGYADKDLEAIVQSDLQFHALILEMTGSRLIAGMRKLLAEFFESVPVGDAGPDTSARVIWEHRELFHAVRDRDVERARTMLRIQSQSWHSQQTDANTADVSTASPNDSGDETRFNPDSLNTDHAAENQGNGPGQT